MLRTKIFLLIGGLLALFLAVQLLWFRGLTEELSQDLGQAAFSVSTRTANLILEHESGRQQVRVEPQVDGAPKLMVVERIVRLRDPELDAEDQVTDHWEVDFAPEEPQIVAYAQSSTNESEVGIAQPLAQFRLSQADPKAIILRLPGQAGVETISVPRGETESTLSRFSYRLLGGSALLFTLALIFAAFLAERLSQPLRALVTTARRVGGGELGSTVDESASGEVGEAIEAFNTMSTRLAKLDEKNRDLQKQQHLGELAEVARGFAHSLRNPLNALGLVVDELVHERLDEEDLERRSSDAREQMRRIDQTLKSFLAMTGGGKLRVKPVDLVGVVEDVALEVAQDPRTQVSVEIEGSDSAILEGVEEEIRAVVQALVINAVEASPDEAFVGVETTPWGEGFQLRIVDRGGGIPQEVVDRLFEPHTTTKAAGSGMGLYLAHRICTLYYGGELEVSNREEGGVEVNLRLKGRKS